MEIEIISRDCWFKVVEMLQQNWALLEPNKEKSGLVLYFISDTSGIFDQIEFDNSVEAERQLWLNGFGKYAEDKQAQGFISPPPSPFHKSNHPNGAIYSSGRYWNSR
ncbi:MAG: hypothetical protein KA473_08315 [Anaerolineales bacterium]|nr:hypothetical protein [Anaerolineales bacterium]MBP6209433.1 hypothetical protein [Anaerolineales bacterium]